LVKPLSFMNDSGRPLGKIARWWKTPPADLLVVVDDLDLPFAKLRMRETGSSGGHNGLKSIIEYFGTEFPRLRVGIGRSGFEAIDHVLSTFSAEEERELPAIIDVAADGIQRWLERGPVDAMNLVNAWRPEGRRNGDRGADN
jgi:PTH1 family peptidyl-tRNA hydrolase